MVGDARELAQLVRKHPWRQAPQQLAVERCAHAHQDGGQQEAGPGLLATLLQHLVVEGARSRGDALEAAAGRRVGELREEGAHALGRIGQMDRAQREGTLQLVGQTGFEAGSLLR